MGSERPEEGRREGREKRGRRSDISGHQLGRYLCGVSAGIPCLPPPHLPWAVSPQARPKPTNSCFLNLS